MNWILINWVYLELVILAVFVALQIRHFNLTRNSIKKLGNMFPATKFSGDDVTTEGSGTESYRRLSIQIPGNTVFTKIINETNEYLKNNIGTADFNIIKSITEGISDSEENAVASTVAVPLYLGLMGTFAGVILGLGNILLNNTGVLEGNNTGSAIKGLLVGVTIAMGASFMGLLLTTSNNVFALKRAISDRNTAKTDYYNFLYAHLLPTLDNSLYSALSMLKSNIYEFNDMFTTNLTLFDNSFRNNIETLGGAVSGMSGQVEAINENTRLQIDLLNRFKKIDYDKVAAANLSVLEKMENVGPLLVQFISEQKSLNDNVLKSSQFIEQVGLLFDRIRTFEESINQLGRDIQQSEMIGGDIISHVKKHLASITEKEELINIYTSKSNAEVKDYLEKGLIRIQEVKRKIQSEFEKAFDFEAQNSLMQNLAFLQPINQSIDGLRNDFKELIREEKAPEETSSSTSSIPNENQQAELPYTVVNKDAPAFLKENGKTQISFQFDNIEPGERTNNRGKFIIDENNDEVHPPSQVPVIPSVEDATSVVEKVEPAAPGTPAPKRSFLDKLLGRPGAKN